MGNITSDNEACNKQIGYILMQVTPGERESCSVIAQSALTHITELQCNNRGSLAVAWTVLYLVLCGRVTTFRCAGPRNARMVT